MNAAVAVGLLQGLVTPAFTTADAAVIFRTSLPGASKMLARLAAAGVLTRVCRGIWAFKSRAEPLGLCEYVTAPYPSYVSLLSALHIHGMITQIPAAIYLVSLSRSHAIHTTIGTYRVHRIAPELFGGFVTRSGVKLATPEKALFDVLYLSGTRTRLFAHLPEVELPRGFKRKGMEQWIRRIRSPRWRSLVKARARVVISGAAGALRPPR